METPQFKERIAKERNCAPELFCAIASDCFAALHESTFKQGIGAALISAYWELGPLAAYHFCCILANAAEHDPGELIEHYDRLDPSMRRFGTIRDQWEQELKLSRGDD